ncbi:MAG: hypothetical protein ACYCV4_02545 [Dermatophilaceae bacterium]
MMPIWIIPAMLAPVEGAILYVTLRVIPRKVSRVSAEIQAAVVAEVERSRQEIATVLVATAQAALRPPPDPKP